jgi:capsular exopolysaccharide synthesis family protein
VVAFIAAMAAAAAITFSLPKIYSTVAYLWVTPASQARSDFEATQTSQVLTRTYAELLQTRPVADAVAAKLPYKTSGSELQGDVKASPVSQSQLLAVEAEARTPERARLLANTYARVFRDETQRFVTEGATRSSLTIATPATLPDSPSRPRPTLYLTVAALLAALLAAVVALLREALDKRLRVDTTATEVLGLPVLARLPDRRPAFGASLLRGNGGAGADRLVPDEPLRLLVANLSLARLGETPKSLAVTSPTQNPGKTACATDLALVWAEAGMRVLLVDADFDRRTLTNVLGLEDAPGLSSCLDQQRPLREAAFKVGEADLAFVPAGPWRPNPSALRSSLSKLDSEAREHFDLILYDTAPLMAAADAPLVASVAEGSIMVISSSTEHATAARANDRLGRARAEILGVVISGLTARGARRSFERLVAEAVGPAAAAPIQPAHDAGDGVAPEGNGTAGPRRGLRGRLGTRRSGR